MKKKSLFGLFALATMLFTASCQEEDIAGINAGNSDVVTFAVNMKQTATTRAAELAGRGAQADKLYYGVYEKTENGWALIPTISAAQDEGNVDPADISSGNVNVEIKLAKQKEYSVIFWATNADNDVCDVNWATRTMTMKNGLANNEANDAFWAYETVVLNGAVAKTVDLYRPFAQLNIGASKADFEAAHAAQVDVDSSLIVLKKVANKFNMETGTASGEADVVLTYAYNAIPDSTAWKFPVAGHEYLAFGYVLVDTTKALVDVELAYKDAKNGSYNATFTSVPVQRNYRTNIYGNLLSNSADYDVNLKPELGDGENIEVVDVATAQELVEAIANMENMEEGVELSIVLTDDIDLNDLFGGSNAPATRAAGDDPSLTIAAEKELTIDLNGKKLSATSTQTGKNYNMFDVRGTLTMKNGTIEYKHLGENMGWNNSTNLFNVTDGGVLNLEGITAMNLGGSDMGFVAHLNNWGEVTLNVDNSTLKSNYVPVRVFNSGNDMNNVTIKNSTLEGGSCAFWVHNYTVADFGTEAKAEAQKALLNINIYGQGNTFSPDVNGIRYGFTNSMKTDSYGITKTVSEDGAIVTLGTIFENGLIRRGVAGDEENTTIKKVVVEEGIATLYDRTFRRFYALETVELPSTLTTIGAAGSGVFQSCPNLKDIVLPEGLTTLGKGSFQECTSLESINIPAGVTRIESDALRNTGLKEVEFHAGVTYFGAQAFRDCKQLTKVVINAPEFTMEGNTFGVMAAPYPTMTIEVANAEMKAYVENMLTAHAKTYITVVAPDLVNNTAVLQAALAEGKNVVLANDLTISASEMLTAPYGNKTALIHNGGVFDGNGKTISATMGGDNYAVMTNGGTIKNLTIDNGFRGIVIMSANQTIKLENVVSSGEGVCYALNTAEGNSTQDLVATNCTFNGWSSWSLLKSATFTNCTFGQGEYYTNVYGRLGKPYVTTLFDGCEFGSKFYIDLSALGADQVVTLKNCTVNGVKLTAENWTSLVAPEDTCGEGQISIELKDGSYMTANNDADYVIFE